MDPGDTRAISATVETSIMQHLHGKAESAQHFNYENKAHSQIALGASTWMNPKLHSHLYLRTSATSAMMYE